MTGRTPRGSLLFAVVLAGCSTMHIPPPANLGAPLPPAAAEASGLDANVGAQLLLYAPVALHLEGAKALPLGDSPFAVELGGNLGSGFAGINPAVHWTPSPKPGADWRYGTRLGVLLGAGDVLGEQPFADPYLGGSLHGQASRVWDDGGAITTSLGWSYTGHARCMGGCSYSVPSDDPEDPEPDKHSYLPYHGPIFHLRADLPAGSEGYAFMVGLGAQPLWDGASLLPIFELSLGLHHKQPRPGW